MLCVCVALDDHHCVLTSERLQTVVPGASLSPAVHQHRVVPPAEEPALSGGAAIQVDSDRVAGGGGQAYGVGNRVLSSSTAPDGEPPHTPS